MRAKTAFNEHSCARAATESEWNATQQQYWDRIAPAYDALYKAPWSVQENAALTRRLAYLSALKGPDVLDLGCGTGLVYKLCHGINPNIAYMGVDVSPGMLARFRVLHPGVPVCVGTMDNLSGLETDAYDVVVAAFTALSYASCPRQAISEIYRVLKPGGRALMSVINQASLRRRVTGRKGTIEWYSTRGSDPRGTGSTPGWTFSARDIGRLVGSAGFLNTRISGAGFLSGVVEWPTLWLLSELLTRWFPRWCHTLEIDCEKPYSGGKEN